jgi:hypothetical protein
MKTFGDHFILGRKKIEPVKALHYFDLASLCSYYRDRFDAGDGTSADGREEL